MIRLEKLVKTRGEQTILNGIDLEVVQGEVCVLIGPSGGGKSTLLRCLNGLESFDSGSIQVGDFRFDSSIQGKEREALLVPLRRKLGMVFQSFNLFANLSVLENVMAGPKWVLGESPVDAEKKSKELLHRVGLAEKANSRPNQLSGGQQQRVAIARALAVNPVAMLFDEPTSALDPELAAEVTQVIAELAREGRTMMVVTHDMDFAKKVGTRVIRMARGQIVQSGSPSEMILD